MNRDFLGFILEKEPNLMNVGETEDSVFIISLHRKFSLGYLHCVVDFSKVVLA